jgi:hypothetical protein
LGQIGVPKGTDKVHSAERIGHGVKKDKIQQGAGSMGKGDKTFVLQVSNCKMQCAKFH